jgi:hypothetical protein
MPYVVVWRVSVTDVSLALILMNTLPFVSNKDVLQLFSTNRTGSTTGCRLYDNNRSKVCSPKVECA